MIFFFFNYHRGFKIGLEFCTRKKTDHPKQFACFISTCHSVSDVNYPSLD